MIVPFWREALNPAKLNLLTLNEATFEKITLARIKYGSQNEIKCNQLWSFSTNYENI